MAHNRQPSQDQEPRGDAAGAFSVADTAPGGGIDSEGNKESGARSLLFVVIVAALSVLFVFFVARLAFVYGESMENTLTEGDVLIVWQLLYDPRPGDVVVTKRNEYFDVRLTKRVIAVGGQHIVVSGGRVTLDGAALDEPYVKEARWDGPDVDLVVPEGHVFLMGDNRNHSRDSREIGPLPAEELSGKVIFHF